MPPLVHRGKSQARKSPRKPQAYQANGANPVWSWGITYLASRVHGQFFRLYRVMDIYSRKIAGWEVHEGKSAQQAATLIEKACWAEHVPRDQLVLYADNGSPLCG